MCAAWEAIPQVTIAAIEGYAIGGGIALALACDFRVLATTHCELPEISLGMPLTWERSTASCSSPDRRRRSASQSCASECLRRGACAGIVDYVAPAGGAEARAHELGARGRDAEAAVRLTKETANAAANALLHLGSHMEAEQFAFLNASEEGALPAPGSRKGRSLKMAPVRSRPSMRSRTTIARGRGAQARAPARARPRRLRTAGQVARLHEALCFLRAYPDDARVAARVEACSAFFAPGRSAVAARRLADSGIAGTTIRYRFFWPTACWLAHCWPAQFRLDRNDGAAEDNIAAACAAGHATGSAVAARAGAEGYDALRRAARARDRRRVARAEHRVDARRHLHPRVVLRRPGSSCELVPGRDTPTRTLDRHVAAPAAFRTAPLRRARPDLREEIRRAPQAVRMLGPGEGARVVELCRGAMITRKRDLDASPTATRATCASWTTATASLRARRRGTRAPDAARGRLWRADAPNGVPIGYSQLDVIAATAAVSFNTFPTFRGGEAAYAFAACCAGAAPVRRRLVQHRAVSAREGNKEGIESGLGGFTTRWLPPARGAGARIARRELARCRRTHAFARRRRRCAGSRRGTCSSISTRRARRVCRRWPRSASTRPG